MKSKAREMTERMKENPMEKYTYDFSVNINPLGLPEGVIPHVAASLEQCRNYPDPSCGALGTLLSGKYRFNTRHTKCQTYTMVSSVPK